MGQGSRWAFVIYHLKESKWGEGHYGLLLFTPDRVKLAVNSKKKTNNRVKMGKGSKWASVIYPLKELKWDCCCLPPDRVKLIVNSKKEINSRVKMGKESEWGKGHYGVLLFTP